MAPLIAAAGVAFAILSSSSTPSCSVVEAFAPAATTATGRGGRHPVLVIAPPSWRPVVASVVRMSGGEEGTATDDSTAATVEDSALPPVAEDERPQEDDGGDNEEERKKTEVEELKLSIASLESSLKAKKSQLSGLKEQIDKYSSAGYARQVASVENAKRVRGANVADDKTAARASVLRSFLPALDELDVLGARYGGNDFARTFDSGIKSELESTLRDLGVLVYEVSAGQSILDVGRIVAVEQEHSEEYARGTAIRTVKAGLEISRNVIRPAEVVGSLGREEDVAAAVDSAAEAAEGEGAGDVAAAVDAAAEGVEGAGNDAGDATAE
jgi:molecular chaperone GrpE (heat shock protein)